MSKDIPELTGGNVNYYLLPLPSPKRLPPCTVECEDIIEALGMTFAEGCAFKAIWRSCAARTLHLLKKGQLEDGVYDGEKAAYYGARIAAVRIRLRDAAEVASKQTAELRYPITDGDTFTITQPTPANPIRTKQAAPSQQPAMPQAPSQDARPDWTK